jgi:hypothetical protein
MNNKALVMAKEDRKRRMEKKALIMVKAEPPRAGFRYRA